MIRFREGRVRVLTHRNTQARRFNMVLSSDVVISIEGERGTRSILDMAMAIERPVLPLPFGGGVSRENWENHRQEIQRWFRMTDAEVTDFDRVELANLTDAAVSELVVDILARGFTQSCFVVMRFHEESDPVFDEAICPALADHGLRPWRTDRTLPVGNVIEAIRDGLRHCHFAIADTTGDRPNVMYELGMVHALAKPVLLLRQDTGGEMKLPFDLRTETIHEYKLDELPSLRQRLSAAIATIRGHSGRRTSGAAE